MKGYTLYSEGNGLEIRATTATKEDKGRLSKEGRITIRFFSLEDKSKYLRFILTPAEAYWGYLKTMEIAKKGGKSSLTHKFDSGEREITTSLNIEKRDQDGKSDFLMSVERGETSIAVSMDTTHFLFAGELLRALSTVQAWSSFERSDSEEEKPEEGASETQEEADAGGLFAHQGEGKPASDNGNRLLGVEIEAVRKDGKGLKAGGRWFTITEQSRVEVDELLRGMTVNLSYMEQENGNPLVNTVSQA